MRIEELWDQLRRGSGGAQRRVDGEHPLDLYADFEKPDRPGLVLFCSEQPADHPSLRAIGIERRLREDGRWSMRIVLEEPQLLAVFSELCRDIIDFTRTASSSRASSAVLSRLDRWRTLLQAERSGLSRNQIRGLIGELLYLEQRLLPALTRDEAVAAWNGPLGADQDFRLPSGQKIEVKAASRDAVQVRINGLSQLDGGSDPLKLAVVRLEETGAAAAGAVTLDSLIYRLRDGLSGAPHALDLFEAALRFAGWDGSNAAAEVIVRLTSIDEFDVVGDFPRLTRASAPSGVLAADYDILLPGAAVVQ